MKVSYSIVTIVAASVAFATFALAASRAEFDQLVQQLQAKPSDNALRERVIKMAQDLKPAPAITEEARAPFVEGATIAKTATDASQQKLAVQSFKEALKIAPWWGEAYYNLAVAQELAGQFEGAKASLKFYLLTKPQEKEARDAQDRIYALNAKIKLAATKKPLPARGVGPASPASPAAQIPSEAQQKEDLLRQLDGAAYKHRLVVTGDVTLVVRDYSMEIRGSEVTNVRTSPSSGDPTEVYRCTLTNLGCELFRWNGGYAMIQVDKNQVIEKDYFNNGNLADTITYTRQN